MCHFLRVLSEFPSERTRFKEMARRRAVATEGAAEQMQYHLTTGPTTFPSQKGCSESVFGLSLMQSHKD